MKNKKIFVILTIIISLLVALFFEIFVMNFKLLNKQSDLNPTIIESKDIDLINNEYITTSDNSYIVINIKDYYINKINFDYESEGDFPWSYSYFVNNEEIVVGNISAQILNKAVKKVDKNTDKLKITINSKNVKISNIQVNNSIYINWYRVLVIFVSLTTILLVFKFRDKISLKLEKTFVILALVYGVLFIIISPKTVYTSYDDQIHFSHALNPFKQSEITYSYAEQMIEIGSNTRNDEYTNTLEEKQILYDKLNELHKQSKNRVIEVENGRSFYANIVYIPFYIGYKLGNILNFDFTICFMLGKFFNLLLYIFMYYIAIKESKYLKKVIFLLGLIPTSLFYATQYSYDPTIISGLTLATVFFINMMDSDKINKKDMMCFLLSIIWASLPKAIYCIFLLVLLFIPNSKFKSKKQANLIKFLIIFITIMLLITFVLPAVSGQMSGDPRGGNTSVNGQIKYILSSPMTFIKLIITFTLRALPTSLFGINNYASFGYLISNKYFSIFHYTYLIDLLYFTFTGNIFSKYNARYKLLMIFEAFATWILFCTALYLQFTPVGSDSINGVQARYMLPMYLPILSALTPLKIKNNADDSLILILIPTICLSSIFFLMTFRLLG